jgi:hypothetical protein
MMVEFHEIDAWFLQVLLKVAFDKLGVAVAATEV